MANLRTLHRSFAGGEMATEMFGRIDDRQFQAGARTLRNFTCRPQGPAVKRPGLQFLREVRDSTKRTRLIPFAFSTDQAIAVEFGAGYFRFHFDGGTLLYSTPNTYIPNVAIAGVSSNKLSVTAHGLSPNSPFIVYAGAGATAPVGLVTGHVYYARIVNANSIEVAAVPDGPALTISVGVGASSIAFAYDPGDLVRFGSSNYYCQTRPWFADAAPIAPGVPGIYWYLLPQSPNVYEIPNGYAEADLFDVTYDGSFDVLTLAHRGYPVTELRRLGTTKWVTQTVSFAPGIGTPKIIEPIASYAGVGINIQSVADSAGNAQFTTLGAHGLVPGDSVYAGPGTVSGADLIERTFYVVDSTPSPAATTFQLHKVLSGNLVKFATDLLISAGSYVAGAQSVRFVSPSSDPTNTYQVTAVGVSGEESLPSPAVSVTNNLFVAGAYNTITWNAVTGAARYRVYKKQTGLFGYIGQVDATSALTFKDDNIGPDLGTSPPIFDDTLSGSDHPGAVGHFEGRRVFAGSTAEPQKVWMTKSGTESDLTYSIPVVDSDRVAFRMSSKEAMLIRHVVPMQHLLLLTSAGEFRITPVNSDAITPSSVSSRPQSQIGCSGVQPAVVNNALVFCAARGGHVREMGFFLSADGFVTGDLSLRAAHLFDDFHIVDMAYMKAPQPTLWFTSSSGLLLGLTYVPDQQVAGWHEHDTAGAFESVCSIPDGDEDRLYVVVNRDGRRFVERSALQAVTAIEDACRLDSALSYDGAPASAFSGLGHLEGLTVAILADGRVMPPQVVTGGEVSLGLLASKVHIGLAYTARLHTLPLAMQIDGFGQGRTKNVNRAWVRVEESGQFQVGPAGTPLVPAFLATTSGLQTDEVRVTLPGDWSDDGAIVVEQTDPTPLTVVGLTLEVAVGG